MRRAATTAFGQTAIADERGIANSEEARTTVRPPLENPASSSSKDRQSKRHSGRSSGFRIVLLTAPSHVEVNLTDECLRRSGLLQRSSPVTAAGPRRILTVFPILPPSNKPGGHPSRESHPIGRKPDVNSVLSVYSPDPTPAEPEPNPKHEIRNKSEFRMTENQNALFESVLVI